MTPNRNLSLASCIALALGLSACGGDGGGIAAIQAPAPTSTPTPTPTPTAFSIFAPARASTGFGPAPVLAVAGGPNFTSGVSGTTVFPLLQTAMIYDGHSAKPDDNANAFGGSAKVESGTLSIAIEGYSEALPDYRSLSSSSGDPNLDWTRMGTWATGGGWWDYDDSVGRTGVFVTGYQTPAGAVPTVGTAVFAGLVKGAVFFPGTSAGTTHCQCNIVTLTGNASFTANFGTGNVSGNLTNMTAGNSPWNNVAFNSTITGSAFSGTTSVTSAPGGITSLTASATGTVEGRFFGPIAQEAGAVWTLFDGTSAAIGTLSGKHP